MQNKLWILTLISLLSIAFPQLAIGISPDSFEVESTKNFEKGDFENVAMQSDGKLLLGPVYKEFIDLSEPYVWCLSQNKSGDIFAGTGDEGKVYKIDQRGNISLLFDSQDLEILSMNVDKRENLYVGTGPEGFLHKLDKKGNLVWTKNIEALYVWSIVIDSRNNIFVATGEEGKIFKVSPEGDIELFTDLTQDNVTSLLYDIKGNQLYAGTNPNGQIYKISFEGSIKILYDTDYEEIRALALDDKGNLFAAANSAKRKFKMKAPPMPEIPKGEGPSEEAMQQMMEMAKDEPQAFFQDMGGSSTPSKQESAIFRFSPDGLIKKSWENKNLFIYSIGIDEDGQLLIGTGSKGLIYKLIEDDLDVAMIKVDELEILSFLKTKNKFLFSTGNNGKIFEYTESFNKSGTYISEVFDTKFPMSKFGNIQIDSNIPKSTELKIAYRLGDTEEPGDLWSDWSKYFDAGKNLNVNENARFIQFKTEFKTSKSDITPLLNSVCINYIQKNYPPSISKIIVDDDNDKNKGNSKSSRPTGNFSFPTGSSPKTKMDNDETDFDLDNIKPSSKNVKLKIKWKAKDPNGDKLLFSLYFKGEKEKTWKLYKEDITSSSEIIDETSLPDGKYLIKVIASDKRSNGQGESYTAEKISESFLIDNTSPVIKINKQTRTSNKKSSHHDYIINVKISDLLSNICEARYSVNASEWNYLTPDDGIYDSQEESGSFTLEKLDKNEEYTIMVKVIDSSGNIAASSIVIGN